MMGKIGTIFLSAPIFVLSVILFVTPALAGKEGLVCYLPFDDGSGDIARDGSGNGNDAQLINDPRWVAGKFNTALEFDGSNWAEVPGENPNLDGMQELTLEAWVLQETHHDNAIINKYLTRPPSYCLQTYSDAKAYVSVHFIDECFTEAGAYPLGEWYHIAGTYDGEKVTIYINGGEVASVDASSDPVLDTDFPVEIASNHKASFFMGLIDDVAIYSRALTPAEIREDMEKGVISAVEPSGKLATTWGVLKLH